MPPGCHTPNNAREADDRFRHAFETFQKLIARVVDVSERRRLEDLLRERALVDDLTGLHNRRPFMLLAEQTLKEAVRDGRPLIALFLDVDGLKAIDDTPRPPAGDRALRLVAGAVRAACRESDISARLSGDEFAIVLAEAHELDGLEDRVRSWGGQGGGTRRVRLVGQPRRGAVPARRTVPRRPLRVAGQAMYAEVAAKRRSSARRANRQLMAG